MFCTTECWNCEDKTCEHYVSKQELYLENLKLKKDIKEVVELIRNNVYIDYYGVATFRNQKCVDEILEKLEGTNE